MDLLVLFQMLHVKKGLAAVWDSADKVTCTTVIMSTHMDIEVATPAKRSRHKLSETMVNEDDNE